jgi:heme/copper-type cytochrome/quinol oxidase subunit 4
MAFPLMIVVFLVPALASSAIAVHLQYRMHRGVRSAPGPLTAYALIVLTVIAVVAGMLGGVLSWDE